MCVITEKGIKLNNGKVISYDNPDMSQLSTDELHEISTTPFMLLGAFYLHKDLRNIQSDLTDVKSMLGKNLTKLKIHLEGCPINEPAIKDIVDRHVTNSDTVNDFLERKWWDIFKDKVLTAGNIAKAITAIALLFGMILALRDVL